MNDYESKKQKFFNRPHHTGLLRVVQIRSVTTNAGILYYLEISIDVFFRNQKLPKLCYAYGILAKDIAQRFNDGLLILNQQVEVSGRHVKPPYPIDENAIGLSDLGILYLSKLDGIVNYSGKPLMSMALSKKQKIIRYKKKLAQRRKRK